MGRFQGLISRADFEEKKLEGRGTMQLQNTLIIIIADKFNVLGLCSYRKIDL